jgi:hypothetical protein
MDKLLTGPRLGPYYDFLMEYRRSPPVTGEIVLIETGASQAAPQGEFFTPYVIGPETAASVLMILTEIETSALIIQVPITGFSFGAAGNPGDLTFRFDQEFDLLKGNIQNLFEAIRIGSVPPSKAAAYVGELLDLTEQGKDRLLASFIPQEEREGFEKAAAVFGRAWKNDGAEYPKPLPDPDGVLRRMALVYTEKGKQKETPVYTALKERFEKKEIRFTEDGPILYLVKPGDGGNLSLPLDKNGAILIEKPEKGQDFKRLPLSMLSDYEEADKALYRALAAAIPLGIYGGISPEKYPPVLYEYAFSLWEDLLRTPGEEKKYRWLESREQYFVSLEEFCYGPEEMVLVSGYEERIVSESPEGGGVPRLRESRDELIRTFRDLREKYDALVELRDSLKSTLYGSFCILGSGGREVPGEQEVTEMEASAILANGLLSGSVIRAAADRYVLFWSLVSAALLCFCLVRLGPLFSVGLGFALCIIIGVIFSSTFVLSAYWIDPFIPVAASMGAVFSSALFILIINRCFAGRVRQVYGNSIPPSYFTTLIRSDESPALEPVVASAAVIAVRNEPWAVKENQGDPGETAKAGLLFRDELSRWCIKAGGIMAGWEGDTALIAFGSPPERLVMGIRGEPSYDGGQLSPAVQAVKFLDGLLKGLPGGASWYFGIDVGKCAFVPIPGSGYRVYGSPAACSRLLSKFAPRYKVPTLITKAVREQVESIPVRAIRIPTENKSSRTFYTLLIRGTRW